jgi:hypothetical protein
VASITEKAISQGLTDGLSSAIARSFDAAGSSEVAPG